MKAVVVALLIALGYSQYQKIKTPGRPSYTDDCATTSTMIVEGSYQNKNLYVQNPYVFCTDSVDRFCIVSVTINDTISLAKEDFNSSAFEIPLMDYHFNVGDPVRIVMDHYVSGKPKLLNPEVY